MNGPKAILESDLDEIVERTESVWTALAGTRIFLTGATGFFGVWLISALARARTRGLAKDLAVTVLTRDPDAARARHPGIFEASNASLITGDVRDFAIPPRETFTHVIHGATAASAALNAGAPREMFDVVVDGTKRVLELAEASKCSRFLYLSSGAVYGAQPSSIPNVPESYVGGPLTLDPRNAYAEGKRAAELLCAMSSRKSGFELVSARGFAFVGPHLPLDVHFAIGNFIRDALAGKPIAILGDGTPYRSYMYGTDLAIWLWTMLARGRHGVAYNVGSADGRPLGEIADRVARAAGTTVTIAKTPDPSQAPERYVPDASFAEKDLALSLTVPLDEAIRRTLAFHRQER